MKNTTPTVSDKFMEWDVKYVVFDSPTKARIYYKDGSVMLYSWDMGRQEWIHPIDSVSMAKLIESR